MIRRAGPLILLFVTGCVGSTGSDLFEFQAAAAGPVDAVAGAPYAFDSGLGYHVVLTKASLHVGALYLNRALPVSGSQATSCILPGIYVANVTRGRDVDVLDPTPQPFPTNGEATADHALAAEVWLVHGAVDTLDDIDPNPSAQRGILELEGTATRAGESFPFTGELTIDENRLPATTDPSQPGAHPICKERIVSPIRVDLTPRAGGGLLLRIDPKGWFTNVDFSRLDPVGDPPTYPFVDETSGQPNINLYRGIQAREGVYGFEWN